MASGTEKKRKFFKFEIVDPIMINKINISFIIFFIIIRNNNIHLYIKKLFFFLYN